MYLNTECQRDCYKPSECDGSCTHPLPVAASQQSAAEWKTIDSARREMGLEIIAATFGRHLDGTPLCERSPFVSFWMNYQQKFYGEPTHWLCELPLSFPHVAEAA